MGQSISTCVCAPECINLVRKRLTDDAPVTISGSRNRTTIERVRAHWRRSRCISVPRFNVPSAQVRGYMPGSFEIIHPGTNVHMSWDTNSPVGPRHTLLFSVTCVRPRWKLRRSSSGSQAIYTFESGGAQVVVDQVCLAPDGRVRGLISDASGRMPRFQCRGARVAD